MVMLRLSAEKNKNISKSQEVEKKRKIETINACIVSEADGVCVCVCVDAYQTQYGCTFGVAMVPWKFEMVVVLVICFPFAMYGNRSSRMDCADT